MASSLVWLTESKKQNLYKDAVNARLRHCPEFAWSDVTTSQDTVVTIAGNPNEDMTGVLEEVVTNVINNTVLHTTYSFIQV